MQLIEQPYSKQFLTQAPSNSLAMTVFLECLSKIEFLGATLILRVPFEFHNASMQDHARDELGHGEALLNAARKYKDTLSDADLVLSHKLLGEALSFTDKYMQKLFMGTTKSVIQSIPKDKKWPHYYYVLSLIIERRLMSIYPHLQKETIAPVQAVIRQVIADERNHLTAVTSPTRKAIEDYGLDFDHVVTAETEASEAWYKNLIQLLGIESHENSSVVSGARRSLSSIEV